MSRAPAIHVLLALLLLACRPASGAEAVPDKVGRLCGACHGVDGASINPEWPNLAGQDARYLEAQLQAFRCAARGGVGCAARTSASALVMVAPAGGLTDAEVSEIVAYFSRLPPKPAPVPASVPPEGEALFQVGRPDANIPPCATCHLATGHGDPSQRVPRIAGQPAAYVVAQLRAYRDGTRPGDPDHRMRDAVARLSPADVDAVALYVQALR